MTYFRRVTYDREVYAVTTLTTFLAAHKKLYFHENFCMNVTKLFGKKNFIKFWIKPSIPSTPK